jgi:hypothetical protein
MIYDSQISVSIRNKKAQANLEVIGDWRVPYNPQQ